MFYLFTHQIQPLSTSQLLIQIQLCLIQCLNFRRLKFSENVHLEIFLFFENSEKKSPELTLTSHETKLLNQNIRVMLYFKFEFQFELKHLNHVFRNLKFIFHVSK